MNLVIPQIMSPNDWCQGLSMHLTMRLSDAGLRRRKSKLIYPNHRFPPWPIEDAPRDRSNRLLGVRARWGSICKYGSSYQSEAGKVQRIQNSFKFSQMPRVYGGVLIPIK